MLFLSFFSQEASITPLVSNLQLLLSLEDGSIFVLFPAEFEITHTSASQACLQLRESKRVRDSHKLKNYFMINGVFPLTHSVSFTFIRSTSLTVESMRSTSSASPFLFSDLKAQKNTLLVKGMVRPGWMGYFTHRPGR